LTPFPAYYAYDFEQSQLVNSIFLGMLNLPAIRGYEFQKNDCPDVGQVCRLWILRSLDGADHLVELPDMPYQIYDPYGAAITPSRSLVVSVEPVYIELPYSFSIRLPQLLKGEGP
jgi:hypothetical protein